MEPILFLIFFNDISKSTLLFVLLFADDTTLLASGKNLGELINFVNTELQKLSQWFRANKMSLHPLKTKFTIFYPKPERIFWNEIDIYIDENEPGTQNPNPQLKKQISYVNHESDIPAIKFLGIFFDPSLNFKYHITQLCTKLSKSLFILRRCKNILSKEALKALYYSTFHCHLVYGTLIYSSTNEGLLKQIAKKQKIAIRCITNSKYNAHTDPLFNSTKIVRFEDMREIHSLQFMHNFKFNSLPISFEHKWQTVEEQNPKYPLRNSSDFVIPRFRIEKVKRFPTWSIPCFWNSFPDVNGLKNIPSKILFSSRLKKHFISRLPIVCNIQNCYVCNANLN